MDELLWTFPFSRVKIQIFLHKITPRALFLQSQSQGKGEDHSQRDGYSLRCFFTQESVQNFNTQTFQIPGFCSAIKQQRSAWECSDLCFIPNTGCETWHWINTWTPQASIFLLHPLQLVPFSGKLFSGPRRGKKVLFFHDKRHQTKAAPAQRHSFIFF